jgi:cellulose synthase/poly-beta-1,6-N-acetylglucosamine synthase-like glycosyltransferase
MTNLIPLPDLRLIEAEPVGLSVPRPGTTVAVRPRQALGQILLDMRAVDPGDMLRAVAIRERQDVRLGDILLAHRWVSEADLMTAQARQFAARAVDVAADLPDARLVDRVGAEVCLAHAALPWRRVGAINIVATARPEAFGRFCSLLPADFGPVAMAVTSERAIHAAILALRRTALVRRAETRTPAGESCRSMDGRRAGDLFLAGLAVLALAALTAPAAVLALLVGWAALTLILTTGLKAAAFASEYRASRHASGPVPPPAIGRLPVVSLLVPLYHEDDIAPRLIDRLGRLDYPRELLDILLIVEEDDLQTHAALAARRLPAWMRVVTVPRGPIRTKPRALNFALDFCRGSIVGGYDAEDAPEPGQIRDIVRRFHERGPEVACLQGILDYYDSRHNWLTRCFTVEYAAWFRVMLPGIARLGCVVPLGGTTLFFRRPALEELGGWDAYNVTEDADLGLRLARHGYRTELVATVTEEEPNAAVLPWIRQRSRWQKGYAMTWAVHMRNPARLWRDLGAWPFLGVQILFLGSLSQAVLAPVLWSFWAIPLGLGHPLQGWLSDPVLGGLVALFVGAETLNIAVGMWAVRGPKHRHLLPWVPTMHLYFPLAAAASYKALWETVRQPFHWDKTRHGILGGATSPLPPLLLTNPILVLTNPLPPAPARVTPPRPRLWSHPAPQLIVPIGPTGPSVVLHPPRRSGIEFQPRLEGF